ncbi:LysM peptidoglycan-binding domain-containing M23 family metallopeptidase [Deinococcus cellulosilyticus]|uniref:LysM domain-containing protein n=1 Tax=Deinococcus cellulosilyticus (strain DSM 18568 / NBRC 106333 / KACC 11606 / 5516J-15) TaxID=1223518 RepID=A0A511MYA7_DEIC1|nr:M23 family metallopeptidase [Deinococcus cellulosilyticus]GEM45574.1 hypothetical protein DC3_12090 [Deinococcus cellulosilyticus NBRC 106333 = KACC 11606]
MKPTLFLIVTSLLLTQALAQQTYTVKQGDTLSRISQKLGVSLEALQTVNPQLSSPHSLKMGQVLKLPTRTSRSNTAKATVKKASFDQRSWTWPAQGRMVSGFGYRKMVVAGTNWHPAIDIMGKTGSPILAARPGTVTEARWDATGYGYMVLIDHGDGLKTRYSHNSKLLVTPGQQVQQGQTIALMGQTGFATVPHLDFRVYVSGKEINPMTLY